MWMLQRVRTCPEYVEDVVVTDFHAHVFPDRVAGKAIAAVESALGGERAHLDGRLGSLLESMDRAGIDRAVICSIATTPRQFDSILAFSRSIASRRIVPFLSVHPEDPAAVERLEIGAREGFKGVKLHPYYQKFFLDDDGMMPIYRKIEELGLILVAHTGFDAGFPMERRCDPARVALILDRFPGLRLVATHLGAWRDWDAVKEFMVGRSVYMEVSDSLHLLSTEQARDIILNHKPGRILFGTDTPWCDQLETLEILKRLDLGEAVMRGILEDNAAALLGD